MNEWLWITAGIILFLGIAASMLALAGIIDQEQEEHERQ